MVADLEWLGDEWAARAAELVSLLPEVPGASGSVSLAFVEESGRKGRETGLHWRYRAGVPCDGAPGVDTGADLVMLVAGEDALALLGGEVEPSVAFMRGRLKASGNGALLLGFLRSTTTPGFQIWREEVARLALAS